eukprot:scaffold725_cov117-Isochrysis_galbana.AAC.2
MQREHRLLRPDDAAGTSRRPSSTGSHEEDIKTDTRRTVNWFQMADVGQTRRIADRRKSDATLMGAELAHQLRPRKHATTVQISRVTSSRFTVQACIAIATVTAVCMWEYELYGGAQLAPHRLYVLARLLTPPKGVWEGPRAIVHLPRNTRCRFLSPPPCAFLASSPRAWEVCLFLC